MCRRKPAPRCANHARKKMLKAIAEVQKNPTPENQEAYEEAKEAYCRTPKGRKEVAAGLVIHDAQGNVYESHQPDPDRAAKLEQKAKVDWQPYKEMVAAEKEAERLATLAKLPPDPLDGDGREEWSGFTAQDETGSERKYDALGVDADGFTPTGYNVFTGKYTDAEGYNRKGFNPATGLHRNGTRYNEEGVDMNGLCPDGFRPNGWNHNGTIHRDTGTKYDPAGYDITGTTADGWGRDHSTPDGWLPDGTNKHTGTKYDTKGFDRSGIHKETGKKFDAEGYDRNGYDKKGFDRHGFLDPERVIGTPTLASYTDRKWKGDFLIKTGINEAAGWTPDGKPEPKLITVVVKKMYRYRNDPVKMVLQVRKAVALHKKRQERRKFYVLQSPHNPNFARTFGSAKELRRYIEKELGQIVERDESPGW